uniref:Activating transcription factor 7-interacting protein 1-like isoform X2 n=1 Tax=Crassostrea virginica TaxID=6565 RepID=A0A8B8B8J4_CRAVI|nr:activating transcription factor 7-interacting protein 1-like isoform X2 [Crassostrea virginica]
METEPGPVTQTDANANKLPRCRPPVPKKPSISPKPANLTRSTSTTANQDVKAQKPPPPLPKTPPNCGVRKSESTSNVSNTPLTSTSARVSSTNIAQPDPSISSHTTINGTFDQSVSSSQNVYQSHITNSSSDQNQNTASSSSNEDLTKFSKSQSFSKSPKPRLPRTSSASKVNPTRTPGSSNNNSPNVVRKSKTPVSKSTFYDGECESYESQSSKGCFYLASENAQSTNSSSEVSQSQQVGEPAHSVGRTSILETSSKTTGPWVESPRARSPSTKLTKKPSKTPPKVPPKVSPKRGGSQKDLSASMNCKPNATGLPSPVSQNVDIRVPDPSSLYSGGDVGRSLTVEINSTSQDVNGNSEMTKVQTMSPRGAGVKTPSPRPRPQPKPRKTLTPSPRKMSENFEEEIIDSTEAPPQRIKEVDNVDDLKINVKVTDIVAEVPDRVGEVKNNVDKVTGNMDKVKEKVDEVKGKVDKMKISVEEVKSTVDTEPDKVEKDEVEKRSSPGRHKEEELVEKNSKAESVVKDKSVQNVDLTQKNSGTKSSEENPVDQVSDICDNSNAKEVDPLHSQGSAKPKEDLPQVNSTQEKRGKSEDSAIQSIGSSSVVDDKIKKDDSMVSTDLGEDLPETSSLLDEIEKIVTKRMNSLENTVQETEGKSQNVPIRPPRPKRESKKTSSICVDRNPVENDFKGSSSSLNEMPPPSGKKSQPPKPKRHKLNKQVVSRSQSDVSGIRSHGLKASNQGIDIDESEEETDKNSPAVPPRRTNGKNGGKGRSLTVDFCVPANQHALLREIALADHRRELESSQSPEGHKTSQSMENLDAQTSLQNTKRQFRPSRKAPPPPPSSTSTPAPKSTKSITQDSTMDGSHPHLNNTLQGSLSALSTFSDEDTSSVEAHEYHYIPEELINPSSTDFTLHKEKSPSPPDLPPRTYNTNLSSSSAPVTAQSILNDSCLSNKDRPESVVSVFSSQSESGSFGHGSAGHDESSSEDSENENEDDKVVRKRAKKVFYIANEICSSEEVFVDVLKLLNVDFRVFISQATEATGKPVIPNEVLNKILNYLPQLQNLNEEILKDLQNRVVHWEENPQVADIFVKKGPFLKLYTSYIKDFSDANEVLDEACKKFPSFLVAVKQFEKSPRCSNLALKHYMLKPIQRIPQYKLLLQDYRKHLTPESPDYNDTIEALKIVSDVADHANESMRQGDHVQKMLEIQKSVEGNYEVIKPGRTFLKEGELMKLSRKEMQPRMFFLFNDVLLYTTPITTGGYRLNNALTLVGMKVSKPKRDDLKTEFNIISIQRSFMVIAKSEAERNSWVDMLQEAIDDQTHRRNTFENGKTGGQSFYDIYDVNYELGSKAPIWIPDTRVTMCMICTSEFSVTWRRHHCRACGRVVCSNCSDNRAPLEYLRNKSMRVCDECFQKLQTALEEKEKHHSLDDKFTQGQDGSFLSLGNLKERFRQIRRSARFTHHPTVKRPGRLHIHASDPDATISGYLHKWHKDKKWKKFWFLMKNNVLYTFKASEDVNATDSVSVLGYEICHYTKTFEGIPANLLFEMKHKNQPPIIFYSEDEDTSQKWIKAMEEASQLKT